MVREWWKSENESASVISSDGRKTQILITKKTVKE